MKDLMMHYGVTNGIRYTKNQKLFFIEEIAKVAKEHDCDFSLQMSSKNKSSLTNIYIGNISKAKVILACAYDTPAKKFITKMDYYPFNDKKNIKANVKQILSRCFVFSIIVMMAYIIYELASNIGLNEITRIGLFAIPIMISFFILADKANKVNFNRNSASIAIAMNLIDLCDNNNFSIVFLDKSVSSHEGLKLLNEKVGKEVEVIILDAIAYGDKLVCAHTAEVKCEGILENSDNVEFVNKLYTSVNCNVLSFFRKSVVLASGQIKNSQFVVEDTQSTKDYQVDIERCNRICHVIRKYVGGK